MFQSKKPKSLRGVRHVRKFRLCTDASRDTQCSRALDTQQRRVIAKRAIHYSPSLLHRFYCARSLPTTSAIESV